MNIILLVAPSLTENLVIVIVFFIFGYVIGQIIFK